MATIEDLEALGYTVGESRPGVLYVSGFGVETYVRADDHATIDSLADPDAHAERVAQFEER